MQIVVLASDAQKAELIVTLDSANVVWVKDESGFLNYPDANAYIDLEYLNTPERNNLLAKLLPKTVIIDSVTDTLTETNPSFVRINAWNTFLSSSLLEGACESEDVKAKAQEVAASFKKTIQWLPDAPGFVTPRVVSMIINEAFIALGEGVSTKEEINTAMKLGTAYPYGPFEWAEKIGVQNIVTLLRKLSTTQPRYKPAELLIQTTDRGI